MKPESMMSETPQPRIPNLPREAWTDAARDVFAFWGEPGARENGSRTNLVMVLANHPPLGMAFNTLGKHLLLDSTLPVRPRELAVLRTSWHLKAEYEWHYHVGYALTAGMTLAEIAGIGEGPGAAVWAGKEEDSAVLSAVDELWEHSRIEDATWAALSRHYSRQQLMDLVFTIGNYVMTSWAIAAFAMPLEEGVDRIGFDLRTQSGRIPGARYRPGEKEDWAEPG
ncbi:MAG: carboxymuconolactone decarboxylase family protein [Sphingobium sp.]